MRWDQYTTPDRINYGHITPPKEIKLMLMDTLEELFAEDYDEYDDENYDDRSGKFSASQRNESRSVGGGDGRNCRKDDDGGDNEFYYDRRGNIYSHYVAGIGSLGR